jgi:hypothetical protein
MGAIETTVATDLRINLVKRLPNFEKNKVHYLFWARLAGADNVGRAWVNV